MTTLSDLEKKALLSYEWLAPKLSSSERKAFDEVYECFKSVLSVARGEQDRMQEIQDRVGKHAEYLENVLKRLPDLSKENDALPHTLNGFQILKALVDFRQNVGIIRNESYLLKAYAAGKFKPKSTI